MSLRIVYTGWQGNGAEGVIVDAVDEHAARLLAWEALIARLRIEANSAIPSDWQRSRLANYEQHNETWRVEPIDLPYIGEFG